MRQRLANGGAGCFCQLLAGGAGRVQRAGKTDVDVQAAAQKWVDSSISKTANVPTDYPYEDFKDIYRYAHEQGLKGCTTFRFNPAAFQGVLVKEADLENTLYRFELEDGSVNRGPAVYPQPQYDVRRSEGKIEVKRKG